MPRKCVTARPPTPLNEAKRSRSLPRNPSLYDYSYVYRNITTFVVVLTYQISPYNNNSMDSQKVDLFLTTSQKYFKPEQILVIKDRLLALDDSKFALISALEYKDPTTILIISIFAGGLGIDRFMLGDTGLGVLKLLTAGACGIWTIIDWFLIQGRTREQNYLKLLQVIG